MPEPVPEPTGAGCHNEEFEQVENGEHHTRQNPNRYSTHEQYDQHEYQGSGQAVGTPSDS